MFVILSHCTELVFMRVSHMLEDALLFARTQELRAT